MYQVKKVTVGKETVKIYQDSDVESPRSWDNLAQMVFFGKHKHLGDDHKLSIPTYNSREDFKGLGAEYVKKKLNAVYVKPVNLYQHSGSSISTSNEYPFNCRWDSGTVGFVVVTKEALRKEHNIKRVTKKYIKQAEAIAEGEVQTLNTWISGDIFGFVIEDENENEIDSCWGFYGSDLSTNGISDHINEKFYDALEIEVG